MSDYISGHASAMRFGLEPVELLKCEWIDVGYINRRTKTFALLKPIEDIRNLNPNIDEMIEHLKAHNYKVHE